MKNTKSALLTLILMGIPAAAFPFGQKESYEDPDTLARLIANDGEKYVLVDVRTPAEYATGHVPTAVNIPHTEIADRIPTDDTSALIIVYCKSGARSNAAKQTLEKLGYTNVVNFGAVSKWRGKLVEGKEPG